MSLADFKEILSEQISELVRKLPFQMAPDPDELWTLDEIAQCGAGHYSRLAEKVRIAKEQRKIQTFKVGAKIAIPYKTILELGLTVNPFLRQSR